jgi:transcriptional regulator GlxA family with amidase domain
MSALERHFSVNEVAEMWNISDDTVRRLFRDEPGVLRIANPYRRLKRGYEVLRMPESVVIKVHEKLRNSR